MADITAKRAIKTSI